MKNMFDFTFGVHTFEAFHGIPHVKKKCRDTHLDNSIDFYVLEGICKVF